MRAEALYGDPFGKVAGRMMRPMRHSLLFLWLALASAVAGLAQNPLKAGAMSNSACFETLTGLTHTSPDSAG